MRVLVIRHGALGDIFMSFPAFAAIRAHHPHDEITLLTTAPFAKLLAQGPWFDRIEVDAKPAPWNLPGLIRLRRQLRGYGMVYDLQTSGRSTRYFGLAGRPPWSGIASGASHPQPQPGRTAMHTRERLADQLAHAGIPSVPVPDLNWLANDAPELADGFVILVPGASPHRPEKRWPADRFAALAAELLRPVVVVGGATEAPLAAAILDAVPSAVDLTGRTGLRELAAICARASLAIGNDTGPMHIAAAFGVPSVVLFSSASAPHRTAPRYPDGGWPTILSTPDLADLPVADVLAALP